MSSGPTLSGDATAGDYSALGLKLHREGRSDEALKVLGEGASLYPENDDIPAVLSLIMRDKGNLAGAIEYCTAAINANPIEPRHKEALIDILSGLQVRIFHPHFREMVTVCLQTREIDHQKLMLLWLGLLKMDPRYKPFYQLGEQKDYKGFKKAYAKLKDKGALADPFFLLGLQSLLVGDLTFERFLTWLRRTLLEDGYGGQRALLGALALYCYHTEYAFRVSAEEERLAAALAADDAGSALMASCYRPFYELAGCEALAEALAKEEGLGEFLKIQYHDYRAQQEIRKTIPTLTPIAGKVSQDVRAQYEGFPYPRWKTLKGSLSLRQLEEFLSVGVVESLARDNAQILIAGCGTGLQALEYGLAFPQAEILAVDLSLSSLSYAVQKQRERGIGNVTFRQADILELKEPQAHFDLIVCTGVLHHMEDPAAGWAALTRLLKPGGLMRIALYSELARQFIVRGRAVIAREGYGDSASEIRRFRADAPRLLSKEDMAMVAGSLDFYALSECRDMLFHVQEHRYTIPRLRAEMAQLGLEFLKFEMPAGWRGKYTETYPDDPAGANLDHWQEFEQRNPLTFLQMYRFWCQRGR